MSEVKTIHVGSKCSIDYKGNKIVFNPDSGVMKATYSYYSFDKGDFKGVDLENMKRPFKIEAECKLVDQSTSHSDDPYSAQPVGGFGNKNYSCKLIQIHEG